MKFYLEQYLVPEGLQFFVARRPPHLLIRPCPELTQTPKNALCDPSIVPVHSLRDLV